MSRLQGSLFSLLVSSATLWGASPVSFNAPLTYLTGGTVGSVAVGDFNGDGKPDMAATSGNADTVSIFLGQGDGTFRPPVSYSLAMEPLDVVTGDFNRDGKLDLAISTTNYT